MGRGRQDESVSLILTSEELKFRPKLRFQDPGLGLGVPGIRENAPSVARNRVGELDTNSAVVERRVDHVLLLATRPRTS